MNILVENKLLRSNKNSILENTKQAKQYVQQGKLTPEELKTFIELDPSPTRKYVGWMAKQFINGEADIDDLSSYVKQFDTLSSKNKTQTQDIYQLKSFKDLKSEIDNINASGGDKSTKDLESDFDVVVDNSDLYIVSPHTHEASRKLGLSQFAFRDCEGGGKDSSWCTTYKAPNHFNDYYYKNNVTFYYIKVKSKDLINKLKEAFPKRWKNLIVVALAILEDGKIDGYDGLDNQIKLSDIQKYNEIIGIS
jgi:hypothetical protein